MTRLLPPLPVLLLCTCWTITCGPALFAQTDSIPLTLRGKHSSAIRPAPSVFTLPEATVPAAEVIRSFAIPAPITALRIDELPVYDNASLLPVLNRIAGVRFEQRTPASYRVAIRGASLRAPFGVRNVQVFWNGMPFGEPGGDVPLNFLDAVNVDEATVIRGPNGGRYGPGTAGTLLLGTRSVNRDSARHGRVSVTAGSYGFVRTDLRLNRQNKLGGTDELRLGYQRTDGYREHSAMKRATVQYSTNLGNRTKLHALYTDLFYELPGGLNAEQFADNPRQARPGSVDKNASINYKNLLLGLTAKKRVGRFRSSSSVYATGFYFDHPFNFDYKRETNLGAGTRAVLTYVRGNWAVNAGAMGRIQQRSGQNFQNTDGRPDDLNFADEIFSSDALAFLDARYAPGKWDFQANLTTAYLRYRVDRTFDVNGNAAVTEFDTNRPLSLRLAAGYRFGDNGNHYLYAARADGFSPPTLDEFRTNEGSLNTGLAPEIGTNYELGYRFDERFARLEAIGFLFALDEAITTFTDERGTQLFRNAGRTRQVGLELTAAHKSLATIGNGRLHGLATYTYYDFTYRDLARGDTDLNGQRLPGAAPHMVNLELAWQHSRGFYFSLFYHFTDATPLNDANDVVAGSFHNQRATVGYKKRQPNGGPTYHLFASGNNLLDDDLNLGYDLNVRFGARYFQPAAGRTVLVGGELVF